MLPSVPSTLEEASASSWDPFPHPCIRLPACLPAYLSVNIVFLFFHNWDPTVWDLSGVSFFS